MPGHNMSGRMLRSRRAMVGLLLLLGGAFALSSGAQAAGDLTVALSMPANLTDNETFEVNVSASNAGPGNAGPGVLVQLYLDGNATGHPLDFNNVGQGTTDVLPRNLTALCGVHSLRAEIDEGDAVPETNETNNNVTVNFTVKPFINVTQTLSGVPGEINVTLSAASSHGCEPLNFTWLADGITQYGSTVTYSPGSGPFSVGLTVRGTGGANFTSNVIRVISIPNKAPSLTLLLPSDNILTLSPIGLVIEALDDDGSVTSYAIQFGDGNSTTSLASATAYRYNTPGDFTITVNVTDNIGGTNGSTIAIHIRNRAPTIDVQEYYVVNLGQEVALDAVNATDPEGAALTISWDFDDGTTGTGALVRHTYAAAGIYTVKLNVTDAYGGTAMQNVTVQVLGASSGGPDFLIWIVVGIVALMLGAWWFMRNKDEEEVPKTPPPGASAPPSESESPSEGISGKPPSP